jgi:flagellar hook assembly protein FlgD
VARVYSPAGRLVKTLVDTRLPAGEHFVPWDGRDERGNRVASGVYFVFAEAGADRASRKVVLLK